MSRSEGLEIIQYFAVSICLGKSFPQLIMDDFRSLIEQEDSFVWSVPDVVSPALILLLAQPWLNASVEYHLLLW